MELLENKKFAIKCTEIDPITKNKSSRLLMSLDNRNEVMTFETFEQAEANMAYCVAIEPAMLFEVITI